MRSRVATAVLVALVGALGMGTLVLVLRARPDRAPVADARAVDVARIVCATDAVRVETSIVRAHRDGVHLLFENSGRAQGFELHAESWDDGTAVGDHLSVPSTRQTFSLPPGRVTVACLPRAAVDPGPTTTSLMVVDPEGLWVPVDLACGRAEQLRLQVAAGEGGDPAQVFRRVSGVRPSDELRKPGYPETPWHWPTLVVFRDGVAVGRISAPRTGEGWELLVDACPGSGIAGA